MRTGFFLLAAAAGLAASMPHAASAQGTDCFIGVGPNRINTVIAAQSTTSQTFVDLPGATVDFNSTGDCAIVQVTAQVRAADPRMARIRVVIDDGTTTIAPAPASLYTSQNRFDQRTARFVLRSVPVGDRILKVQFMSVDGSSVSLSKVITTVHYDPPL
jgi:hypothetical protein